MQNLLLLLFVFLCGLLAPAAAQSDAAEVGFTREFGAPGATGSFRARFSKQGAGLVFLQSMDHFVSLAAERRAERGPGDYLLLATSEGGDHALRLFLAGANEAFPVDPATAPWTVATTDSAVTFTLDGGNGLALEKVLRHDPLGRGFTLEVALRNVSSAATGALALQLTGPALVNATESSLFGTLALSIAAALDGTTVTVPPAAGKLQTLELDPNAVGFVGSTNRFFGAFLWPHDTAARAALQRFDVDTVPRTEDPTLHVHAFSSTRVRYGLSLAIPPQGGETRVGYGLYLGPKSYRVFATLPQPERFAAILDVDLNPPCCGGVTVPGGRPMAKLLLKLLGWFHDLIGNWGIAIIMLTVLVRGLLAPLNFRMQKSMRAYASKMAVLKPKLDALKEKHGDDKAAYQQAMIAFQREHKMMPPLGGCLPIFLTMPIYIGLFTALRTAYDLRHQSFVSWIDDLSRADALFQLGFWPHDFNLLPLVWIGLFVWMSLRQPLPSDPQQRQMQMYMRFMPILFGVMLYNYASALMVYMVTSMVWSLVESTITKRILGPMDPNVAAMAPTPM
ncbi:MAG: membrane protein insertase YidC [Planctomycetes bacterium]|nr:membrane protein insertase YidC [Planctomycetota bacterium]